MKSVIFLFLAFLSALPLLVGMILFRFKSLRRSRARNKKEGIMPEVTEGKLKYDILRNGLRRMIAEGKFEGPTKNEVRSLLESARGDDLEALEITAKASSALRKVVRAVTGSNGEPVRDEGEAA